MLSIHRFIAFFPIDLITFSLICDFVAYFFFSASLRATAFWALVGALTSSVMALATGHYVMYRGVLVAPEYV